MDAILVTIQCRVDDHFPGWVQCMFVDAEGIEHLIVEKEPVVSMADLSPDSIFPQPGGIDCIVQDEWVDEHARNVVRVSTEKPSGIESTTGETTFTVLREQIARG